MGSRGLNLVGGDDFDTILATRLAAAAGTDSGKLGDTAWERLIEDARSAKEALSPSTKFITVPVDGEPTTITVADFYKDATALVDATIAAMEPLLIPDASGVGQLGGDIAGLYVVGGGSQLPLVARILRARFGRRVHRSPHTAASTAIGLAIGADPEAAYTVREQLSRGVGVFREREAGSFISFDTLLEPNTKLAPGETLTIKRRYRASNTLHSMTLGCLVATSNLTAWSSSPSIALCAVTTSTSRPCRSCAQTRGRSSKSPTLSTRTAW